MLEQPEDQDNLLGLVDEIYQELILVNDYAMMEQIMTSQDTDLAAVLENNHVLCKICCEFIDQTTENSNIFICNECIGKYFVDECVMNSH